MGDDNNTTIEKLEKWVNEHPKEADAVHINLSTGRKFTIREVLGQMKGEGKMKALMLDPEMSNIKSQISKWLG